MEATQTRADRWLWAVRAYKTRALASEGCKGGHVEVNGHPAKPSTAVKIGDRVVARVGERTRDLEVVRIIEKRVGAAVAATCFVDHTPRVDPAEAPPKLFARDRGTGRPTKRDRRQLERLREDLDL